MRQEWCADIFLHCNSEHALWLQPPLSDAGFCGHRDGNPSSVDLIGKHTLLFKTRRPSRARKPSNETALQSRRSPDTLSSPFPPYAYEAHPPRQTGSSHQPLPGWL
ncbi:hypothetical protein HYQ46_012188 [Verticillium longisporum]|nr:hypothetical protein HYQ46_012188 [Verticillium longisporum]